MLYGIRDGEQRRLADAGSQVRVYVPFGTQWYGYFMRRLAERPANLTFFLRALAARGIECELMDLSVNWWPDFGFPP